MDPPAEKRDLSEETNPLGVKASLTSFSPKIHMARTAILKLKFENFKFVFNFRSAVIRRWPIEFSKLATKNVKISHEISPTSFSQGKINFIESRHH